VYDGKLTLEGALAQYHTDGASSRARGSALHYLIEEHWGSLKKEYSQKIPGNGMLKRMIDPEKMSSLEALPIVKVYGEELIEDNQVFFSNVYPGNLTRFLEILRREKRSLWEIVKEYPQDAGIVVACIALYKFGLHDPEWRESDVLTDDFVTEIGQFLTHEDPHVVCMGLRIAHSIVRRWTMAYLRKHRHILELIRKNKDHPDPLVSSLSLRFLARHDDYFDMDLVKKLLNSDSMRDRSDAIHLLHIASERYSEIPMEMVPSLFDLFKDMMLSRVTVHHQNDIVLPFMRIPNHEVEKVEFLMSHILDPRCKHQQSLLFIVKNLTRFFPWKEHREQFWDAYLNQRNRRELLGEIFACYDDMEFYDRMDSLQPEAATEGKLGFLSKRKVPGTLPFLYRILQDMNISVNHGIYEFSVYKSLQQYTTGEILSDQDLDSEAKRYLIIWCGLDQQRSKIVQSSDSP
jgi:hypothetical protein